MKIEAETKFKICSKCNQLKKVSDFTKRNGKSVLGFQLYQSICKKCCNERARVIYANLSDEKKKKYRSQNKRNIQRRLLEEPEKLREDYRKAFHKWIAKPGNRELHNNRRRRRLVASKKNEKSFK